MNRYKPTILNIASTLLIICNLVIGDWDSWGGVSKITLIGVGILGLLVDLGIQKLIKRYLHITLIELLILVVVYFFNAWQERDLIITIPDNFRGEIVLIYGVNDANGLDKDLLTQNYQLKNIDDRIIATSTMLKNNVSKTKFITQSGKELYIQPDTAKLHLEIIGMDVFKCDLTKSDYTIWLIRENETYEKERIISNFRMRLNNLCEEI